MVGAIILARREYLPQQAADSALAPTVLTLPERPKELVATGNENE
jgi:NAD(P)H-quinone oxidoreductase subunit 6